MIRLTLLASLALVSSLAFAADHRDAPIATNDVAADINDLYTFVNPVNPQELIVAVTVVPVANALSQFSAAVDYRIHLGDQVLTCRFPGSVRFECTGLGNQTVSGNVGSIGRASNGLRVYAGLRDDPFFFDLNAFNATRNALAPRFNNPGSNFFAGLNTLSIVVGIPNALTGATAASPVVKVYASTRRTGGAGISAGISGSWYDAANPGHGFYLEVVRGGDGVDRLNALWAVYNNAGGQLYLLGTGDIVGNSSTITAISTAGGRFPPPFTASNVQLVPFGTLKFTFNDCNSGTLQYNGTNPSFLTTGTISLNRLTSISGVSCSLLSSGQIDRMGRPGINTALVNVLPGTGSALKNAYNSAEGVANWSQFAGELEANLAALDTLDGQVGNALLPPATLASVLVDDRLLVDTSKAACDEYLAVELGVPGKCGGRTLARDVIDDTFGAVVGPGVSDFVGNDSIFLSDFPFLGNPN